MIPAFYDLGDIRPTGHIALPVVVPSHGDHAAIGLKPHRMIAACDDLNDLCPVVDLAPPVAVVSSSA